MRIYVFRDVKTVSSAGMGHAHSEVAQWLRPEGFLLTQKMSSLENEVCVSLQNFINHSPRNMVSHPRRLTLNYPLWKPENLKACMC